MRVETVKIHYACPRGYAIINACDFDPEVHELFEPAPEPASAGAPAGPGNPEIFGQGSGEGTGGEGSAEPANAEPSAAPAAQPTAVAEMTREQLVDRAEALGQRVPVNIGTETLRKRVAEAEEKAKG